MNYIFGGEIVYGSVITPYDIQIKYIEEKTHNLRYALIKKETKID
jgi:hypothetical protein